MTSSQSAVVAGVRRGGLAIVAALLLAGCSANKPTANLYETFDKPRQTDTTPDAAIRKLAEGNQRFVSGKSIQRNLPAQVQATAGGQFPFAAIVGCLDSRCSPELVFDQGIGDLFVARVAGNYAPVDIVGSLEFATKVSGAKVIVVVGHSECGAIKGACDNVQLGHLTTVLSAIEPALGDVHDVPGDRNSKNKAFVKAVTEANVRRTVAHLSDFSPILKGLQDSGEIKIVGAIQDLSTGEVKWLQ